MLNTALKSEPSSLHSEYLLEIDNISKAFPGVIALNKVSFHLRPGTVHALMGENGAGKSTLMKIIAGIQGHDSGSLRVRGEECNFSSPIEAINKGIAMIHQELNLMPFMTVAENIWISREPKNSLGLISHDKLMQKTAELFAKLKINIHPETLVRELSVANRQMVEIAKAVSYNSDVLIMDEPTSALAEKEVEHLFEIINTLRAEGKGIIYITHKMDELFEIADEVSIFRDGQMVGCHPAADLTRDKVIQLMVGREITQMFPKQEVDIGDVVMSVRGLSDGLHFSDVSFDLRAGEILGFAGLVGSGRTNVVETLFGVTPAVAGSISIFGNDVQIHSPHDAMGQGMALLTEDRKETGCFLGLTVQENMQMAVLRDRYTSNGFVKQGELEQVCEEMRDMLAIKTPSLEQIIGNLSGGNQQKALIARWLMTNPRILFLDEPTRGIDVGAKAEIHRLVSALAAKGLAVILISSEMPEVLGMSDRILVMHEGKVTGILDRAEANQVKIMELASG
ncbi:D-ribose transporter ATP-binding protein [Pokkaliibacter plantistimulans]|uniref:Ribose/galactose/methyl galactoside import ATP-binding protein n=1 Tax=Pokkaliibacter plantistimulans TaxID=1635171 RepID=A0ABX5LUF3_9GAMM|nr:sugar ABC transporter ATP-binding protein [Pokkaliibacter plantistimulans]PXF28911.1 D-ribose transporter ATP-binding protein [Pokkaliibacter plantistimulans]